MRPRITAASSKLEEALLRLNREAEAREMTCTAAGCQDQHFSGKASDARAKETPAPPPVPESEETGFGGIAKSSRRVRKGNKEAWKEKERGAWIPLGSKAMPGFAF